MLPARKHAVKMRQINLPICKKIARALVLYTGPVASHVATSEAHWHQARTRNVDIGDPELGGTGIQAGFIPEQAGTRRLNALRSQDELAVLLRHRHVGGLRRTAQQQTNNPQHESWSQRHQNSSGAIVFGRETTAQTLSSQSGGFSKAPELCMPRTLQTVS